MLRNLIATSAIFTLSYIVRTVIDFFMISETSWVRSMQYNSCVNGTAGWAITNFMFHLIGEILPLSILFYMQTTNYVRNVNSIKIMRDTTCSTISTESDVFPVLQQKDTFDFNVKNLEPSPQSHCNGADFNFKFGFSSAAQDVTAQLLDNVTLDADKIITSSKITSSLHKM